MFNGRRQPSRGGTSRMTRECQVRICEGLGVKFPGPTRRHRSGVLHAPEAQYTRDLPAATPNPAFEQQVRIRGDDTQQGDSDDDGKGQAVAR